MTHRILCVALVGLTLSACSPQGQEQEQASAPAQPAALVARPLPQTIEYPEGIAWDSASGVYYVASAADGAIVRVTMADNTATLVAPGGRPGSPAAADFPIALGARLDEAGRLWVAGGVGGDVRVVDPRTGTTVKRLTRQGGPPSLLNDLAFAGGSAYVTDSSRPVIWRASQTDQEIGDLEPWLELDALIPYADGPNLNGIVATADGSTLIAVQMNTGLLWRIDIATRTASQIDLRGALLRGGDGLVLDDHRLYATIQDTNEIVAIDLTNDFSSGLIAGRLRDDRFVAPATAFLENDRLYVVVSQMNRFQDDSAARPFNIYEVPVSAIGPSD